MAYSSDIFDKFILYASNIDRIMKHSEILDVWLSTEVQAKEVCLMVNPLLTTQRESYSDIEKREVNYQFIIDRFNKNIK